jgi:hypothetical protein
MDRESRRDLSAGSASASKRFHRWKKPFAGIGVAEVRELRSLRHDRRSQGSSVMRRVAVLLHSAPASAQLRRHLGVIVESGWLKCPLAFSASGAHHSWFGF